MRAGALTHPSPTGEVNKTVTVVTVLLFSPQLLLSQRGFTRRRARAPKPRRAQRISMLGCRTDQIAITLPPTSP